MKDQNGIEDGESKQDKWNRGLDIFIESVIKSRSFTPSVCSQSKMLS